MELRRAGEDMNPLGNWQGIGRVLVTGSRGMLGRELMEALGGYQRGRGGGLEVWGLDVEELDITEAGAVERWVGEHRPGVVINCAAYTDVDGCESRRELALAVNGAGPGNLAGACARVGALLVHLSTDFVFDGQDDRPYREGDEPRPVSVYGASKLAGEEAVRERWGEHLIVRVSWLFGRHGKNFVGTIRRLAREREYLEVVNDQVGSPTYTGDLVEALGHLVGVGARGTVHFRNEGSCSWYEFACEIVRQSGLATAVRPITSGQLKRAARRPAWSVLDISRYKELTGQGVRPWQEALAAYLSAPEA